MVGLCIPGPGSGKALLRRSPNILLIPGTSRVAHLRENVAGAGLVLSDVDHAGLDAIAG